MIVARVNNYKIEEYEFLAELNKLLKERDIQQADKALLDKALDNLINGALIVQAAELNNIVVTDDEVQQEILNLQMKFDSEEEYEEALSCTGCSHEQVLDKFREKIAFKKYLESSFSDDFQVDEEYLYEFYKSNLDLFKNEEMVKASHILTSLEDGLIKSQELREKISTPEDFNRMAEKCSECPSGCQSGDLDYIIKGRLVKEIDDVIFNMQVNEISQPIKSEYGYHIIMITDHKEAGTLSFESIKGPLLQRLRQIDYEIKVERHLKDLREKADIEINDNYFSEKSSEEAL